MSLPDATEAAAPGIVEEGGELHGRPWWPRRLRRLQLRGLTPLLRCSGFGRRWARLFRRWRGRVEVDRIVDLGSGTGGHVAYLLRREPAARRSRWILTDRRPDPAEWRRVARLGDVEGDERPVELEELPDRIGGAGATLVSCLHELPGTAVEDLFRRLCELTEGWLAVEPMTDRGLRYLAVPGIPVAAFLAPLLGGPRSADGILLSTLVPLLPLVHLHDGVRSLRRAHGSADLARWTAAAVPSGWHWEVGESGPWFSWAMAVPPRGGGR